MPSDDTAALRAAGPDAPGVQRRLLSELAVAALDHEARDDAMEDHVVVEPLVREVDEVLRGLRRGLVVELDLDVADVGRRAVGVDGGDRPRRDGQRRDLPTGEMGESGSGKMRNLTCRRGSGLRIATFLTNCLQRESRRDKG